MELFQMPQHRSREHEQCQTKSTIKESGTTAIHQYATHYIQMAWPLAAVP